MPIIEVKVPAIGGYEDVPVIDVLVKAGDQVNADDPLVTLESDKATMDVPSPSAGKVRDLKVKAGDRVSEGSLVLTLETGEGAQEAEAPKAAEKQGAPQEAPAKAQPGSRGARAEESPKDAGGLEPVEGKDPAPARGAAPVGSSAPAAPPPASSRPPAATKEAPPPARSPGREAPGAGRSAEEPRRGGGAATVEVKVPAIGGYDDVPVIDVIVKVGEEVAADAPLVTLESDKATMDVPCPSAGTIRELKVKVGDRVSEGSVIAILQSSGEARSDLAASYLEPVEGKDPPAGAMAKAEAAAPQAAAPRPAPRPEPDRPAPEPPPAQGRPEPRAAAEPAREGEEAPRHVPHASPSVRKLARELGVDLARVQPSGPKGRILQSDVQRFVKETLAQTAVPAAAGGAGLDLAPWPKVDFAKFGPIEIQPLSRIRKLSKANLARNWVMIPHVTQHDEADITELEAFRVRLNEEHAKQGLKVTLLAFLVKAAVAAMKRFPELSSSLDGDQLVLKRYFHVGFAADTPNGLVVPVVKDADRKGVLEIAKDLGELAARARDGKLQLADMQGGCFSISSLGGIGGTFFTPIINAPEVAILGVSRSAMKPVWNGEEFEPRLVLPLSLSYDHRVIDGALAARITTYLAQILGDFRRAML